VFASAEEFLQSEAPESAVCLITDVRMPGIDGLELQRRVRLQISPVTGDLYYRPL
jgi:two-component system, LuxR family, response regulator FixJ